MKKFKMHKITAFFLAVLMIFSAVPVMDLSVFAEEIDTSVYESYIGCTAKFNGYFPVPVSNKPENVSNPFGTNCEQLSDEETPDDFLMVILDYYYNAESGDLWYLVEAAQGYTAPEKLISNPWVYQDNVKSPMGDSIYIFPKEESKDNVSITDENGNAIESITLPQYEKFELTAESTLEGKVSYQWQIEYAPDKWVDIYGENSKTVKISYGMVATLLDANESVHVRCRSTSGSKVVYSKPIKVTLEMYQPEEPDVVVSESFTTSTGETITVTVAGSLPEDASVKLEETDSTGVDVKPGETVVAALDISIKNSDGTEWQPESGETVTVTLEASKIGLKNGDDFVVYHLHNGEVSVLGSYTVANDTVSFEVDGFSKFVVALTEQTLFREDLLVNVGKTATIQYPYFDAVKDPDFNETPAFALEGTDYSAGIEFIITDVYVSGTYPYSIYYKVEVKSGEKLTDFLDTYTWIYQGYQDEDPSLGTLVLHDAPEPEEPAEPSVSVTVDGEEVTEITVSTAKKVALTATPENIEGSVVTYQWQLLIPSANMWVAISGQTSATCTVNYGMVANRLDANGQAHIKCVTTADGVTYESESIAINISEAAEAVLYNTPLLRSYAPAASNYDVMPTAEGDDTTGRTTVSDPVTITINFVYGSDPDKLVAEPVVSTIQKGTPYELLNYKLPVMEGYDAYLEDDTTTIYTKIDMPSTIITEDITVTFKYWPAKVNYTVIYYWQNADNDGYTEHERVVLIDFTGNMTTVEDKVYDGFYQLLYETVPIASDGSTVIEVYYDRYYYLMLFNLDGGYGVQPVYARHGATLPTLIPTKAGCDFVGWDSDDDSDSLVDSTFPTTMPIGDTNYTAVWQYEKEKVELHIVVWGENPNDEEYSYMKTEVVEYAPGTTVNYMKEVLKCTVEAHSHSASCGYACGKEAHTHENCEYDCAYVNHTHTKDCYPNIGNVNTDTGDANGAPTNAVNGQVYQRSGWEGLFNSYDPIIYINGTWYVYNGNADSGDIVEPTCHTHDESCYACDKAEHIHDSSCGYNCGKQTHWHNDACYTKEGFLDDELWALVKSDEVVVAPDGSTIMNVYYDRTEFTLTFKVNNSTVKTITEKWGAYIYDEFPIVGTNGTEYRGAEWKVPNGCVNFTAGTNVLSIDIMPAETITFTRNDQDDSATLYYYVEALPNENDAGETYREYNGKRYKLYKTVYLPNSGRLTESEEFHPIEGYSKGEYYPSNIFSSVSKEMYLYYTLNTYAIEFKNPVDLIKKVSNVAFGINLGSYDFTPDASHAPKKYEPGSVEFGGWYLNPECTGVQYDLSKHTMPAAVENGGTALVLYAKWTPVIHTVKFYTDKEYVGTDTIYTDSSGNQYIYEVYHGSKIQDPHIPPADPAKGQYQFNGWYYIDANGNEQRWYFKESTVNGDVDIYAKWSSNKLMPYTIKFVYKDPSGKEIEIADPITGSALGGNSKTFDAKGNAQLYDGYREGYFPTTQSHTITIDLEDTTKNEFTFYYVKKDAVPYYVYYVTETQNGAGTLNPIELNGKTYYIVADMKSVTDNKKAIVTETYVSVPGYLPNKYQETLVINPDATTDNPNKIIFVYSVDEKNSMYIVHYYFQDVTGTKYVEDMAYLFQSKAEINSSVAAAILTVENFSHNPNVSGTVLSGKIEKDKILELHVYYDRNPYNYKVQYLEEGTLKVLAPEKIVTGSLWESFVAEKYITIPNYTLSSDAEVTIQIRKDTADPTVNIITFFYTENKVTINYEVVGPAGATNFGSVLPESETVKVSTGKANGSTASASSNVYKFVGWYSNEACTGEPLSTDPKWVPTKEDGTLWADGTTYYAKFEYNLTSLTIKKEGSQAIDVNQSFIFNINGNGVNLDVTVHGNGQVIIDGLTVGQKYTITEKSGWSWRYDCVSWTHGSDSGNGNVAEITIGLDGTITFKNVRKTDKWLDGDSWCNNIFKAN